MCCLPYEVAGELGPLSFHNLCVHMHMNKTKFERKSSPEYYPITRSAYHLSGNFGKKFLTNGTGLENVFEKRNGLELYVCKTADDKWAWAKTNHLLPQGETWHWLTRQMVQKISAVSVKTRKR